MVEKNLPSLELRFILLAMPIVAIVVLIILSILFLQQTTPTEEYYRGVTPMPILSTGESSR